MEQHRLLKSQSIPKTTTTTSTNKRKRVEEIPISHDDNKKRKTTLYQEITGKDPLIIEKEKKDNFKKRYSHIKLAIRRANSLKRTTCSIEYIPFSIVKKLEDEGFMIWLNAEPAKVYTNTDKLKHKIWWKIVW